MLASLAIVVVASVLSALEVPSLWKQNDKKGVMVFFILLGIGVTLWILRSFKVKIPNLSEILLVVLKPLIDLLAL